jgi:hypothetical protein
MSIDYARLQATADRLLSENGQAVTLSRETVNVASYNPATGDGLEHVHPDRLWRGVRIQRHDPLRRP